MAIYVYRLSDGSLYSYCPKDTDPVAPAATLAANGLGERQRRQEEEERRAEAARRLIQFDAEERLVEEEMPAIFELFEAMEDIDLEATKKAPKVKPKRTFRVIRDAKGRISEIEG